MWSNYGGYGVLKGRAIGRRLGTSGNAHYQVHIVDQSTDYRIPVNVASQLTPSELEYLIESDFQHPIGSTARTGAGLEAVAVGETVRVQLVPPVMLPNKGGIITVLNEDGLRVDGVSYTQAQANNPGWTIKL